MIIGTKLSKFLQYCKEKDLESRVIKENGTDYIVTHDLHPDRFNLVVKNGIIIDYYMG